MQEALRESELAVEQDPFSGAAIMNHCRIQYYARQFDQASACLDRLAAEQPNYAGGKYMHGIVYIALEGFRKPPKYLRRYMARIKGMAARCSASLMGLPTGALTPERILTEMQEYQKQHYLPAQELGIIYLGLDDLDHALPLLRQAVEEKFPRLRPSSTRPCLIGFAQIPGSLNWLKMSGCLHSRQAHLRFRIQANRNQALPNCFGRRCFPRLDSKQRFHELTENWWDVSAQLLN